MGHDSDSDGAPEELTFEQGSKQDEVIRELTNENKARVAREKKERRRLWAQRKIQKKSASENVCEATETPIEEKKLETPEMDVSEMLPSNIVDLLVAREKLVFSSDSEEEIVEDDSSSKKKKQKLLGQNTVLLKDLPPPQCAQNSLDFLKKRKSQVARSQAVLNNADQALRLLSSRGGLLSKN